MITCHSQATPDAISSTATTILDDQSSCSTMVPIASASAISAPLATGPSPILNPTEPSQLNSASPFSIDSTADFDVFIDQQLQKTLVNRLRNESTPSVDTAQEHGPCHHRPARCAALTKSETEKLIDQCNVRELVPNSEFYEKQVRSTWKIATVSSANRHFIRDSLSFQATVSDDRGETGQLLLIVHDLH